MTLVRLRQLHQDGKSEMPDTTGTVVRSTAAGSVTGEMKPCPYCEGDGYTETWNDDQSDVVIAHCSRCAATGVAGAGLAGDA